MADIFTNQTVSKRFADSKFCSHLFPFALFELQLTNEVIEVHNPFQERLYKYLGKMNLGMIMKLVSSPLYIQGPQCEYDVVLCLGVIHNTWNVFNAA